MKISDVDFFLVERHGRDLRGPGASLLVRLTTTTNREGWGEATTTWRADQLEARRNAIAPVLIGRNAFDIEELPTLDELREPSLRAAVEMASWDTVARSCGRALHHLLGGGFRRRAPLTVRVPSGPSAHVARLSRELAQQGFHSQTILSGGKPEEDAKTIENIRQNVGEHLELRLDGQGRYDLQTARDLCVELEYAHLECFLDPLLIMELHELAALGRQVNVPLGACRALREPADLFLLARLGSVALAVVDVEYVGGLTAARKCAAVAEAARLPIALSCQLGTGLAMTAMAQLAAATPVLGLANVCDYAQLSDDLLLDAPEVVDGMMAVPQGPGLGVEMDRVKLDRLQAG